MNGYVSGNVVTQASNLFTGGRSEGIQSRRDGTLRLYQHGSDITDGELHLEIASDDDAIGVAFRVQDERHHYVFAMDRQKGFHVLALKDGDTYRILDENSKGYEDASWHPVRIALDQSKLIVFGICFNLLLAVPVVFVPILSTFAGIVSVLMSLVMFCHWIHGIVSAVQGEKDYLVTFLGDFFEGAFGRIC